MILKVNIKKQQSMKNSIQELALNLVAKAFFGQKNFNFIEVGPLDHQLQEADLTFETTKEVTIEEVFVPGNLAFG